MKRLILSSVVVLGLSLTSQAVIHDVSIVDFSFSPASLSIPAGDIVRWTNNGTFTHSSTSTGNWDSGFLGPGQSFQFQFSTSGTYSYFCSIHTFMTGSVMVNPTDVKGQQGSPTKPKGFELSQNYPNPFNATTIISYALPSSGNVTMTIYNILGQAVRTLKEGQQAAGTHSIVWDGKNDSGEHVGTGIYFYRFQAGDFSQVRKMVFLK